ncbi:MAG: hypothetical protein JWM78_489 [Verrucomicrobiaceae bacterium]|nr:hypothetical protein [Verrucomicrobiaceae bacterium]
MPEIKRPVQTVEINYVCDKCGHGMMHKSGETNPTSGETPHKCMICGAEQVFKWVSYPRIDHIGIGEKI